jgi:hypothetical protein
MGPASPSVGEACGKASRNTQIFDRNDPDPETRGLARTRFAAFPQQSKSVGAASSLPVLRLVESVVFRGRSTGSDLLVCCEQGAVPGPPQPSYRRDQRSAIHRAAGYFGAQQDLSDRLRPRGLLALVPAREQLQHRRGVAGGDENGRCRVSARASIQF